LSAVPKAGTNAGPNPWPDAGFDAWQRDLQERFEVAAAAQLPSAEREPCRLHAAMRYAVLDGGKRVRPLLAYAAGEIARAAPAVLDAVALAVEYVHAYSLAHDDLPCMDDDVLRRGKPTVHVAFDVATAMLAGDALQAEAFAVLGAADVDAARRAALMTELALAAGTNGMCGGQAIDLAAVGQALNLAELERMHRMKTGALLAAAVRMGGMAGALTAPQSRALADYGERLGLAFQIVDDVLDVAAPSAQLGKTAGKDAQQNKPTYVSVLGIERAQARARALHAEALVALSHLGDEALRLRQMADFIVLRSY
jgi:farnesyl diphosphate synthase